MRSLCVGIVVSVLLIILESDLSAFEPVFKRGKNIKVGGTVLDVGRYSVPSVCDWNNDGRKDLVVGQFWDGKVRLYINRGTDSCPVFTAFTFLEADGEVISVGHY
jgi:hypothetical protein